MTSNGSPPRAALIPRTSPASRNAQNHGSPFSGAHRDLYLSGADNEDGVALIAFAKENGATWVFHSDGLRFQEVASIVTEAAEGVLSGVWSNPGTWTFDFSYN